MEANTERTWAEISLENIVHNMHAIRAALPAGTKFLGVVKANAYGHGAVPVARALEENGADYLAVACLDEALELRQAGIALPILILGCTPAQQTGALIENGITQAVGDLAAAQAYAAEAAKRGAPLRIHIKLETGMGRLGFSCAEEDFADLAAACRLPQLQVEGVFTHFAVSDEPEQDGCAAYTRAQFARFMGTIAALEAEGVHFAIRHCANSGAVVNYPEMALDMVRPGILLYGYGDGGKLGLKPCMRVVSRIAAIQHYGAEKSISYGRTYRTAAPARIGVVPIGYADGLHRCLSNRISFALCGAMAPQRGRICMDMCMLDLSALPQAQRGTPVEIFGARASLDDMAAAAGTITYELLCSISRRVPRVYRAFSEDV